jgi:hypothetical protein
VQADDASIDVRMGRSCDGLRHVPVCEEKKRQQQTADKDEVSTEGHAHHRCQITPESGVNGKKRRWFRFGLERLLPIKDAVDQNDERFGPGRASPVPKRREKVEHLVLPESYRLHRRKLEEDNLRKFLMIGAVAFAATSIADTATAAEFYVVRDTATKRCTVVDTKPTTTTTTVVDNGTFKTKTEAETGMKSMKVCTQ